MAYNEYFKVTTARFANVAFSNGSLPDGWIHRLQKKQPLVAPSDVKRYFVSPEESGQICMLACILGHGGEVFFPKLGEDQMLTFSAICDEFVKAEGFEKKQCANDAEAIAYAAGMDFDAVPNAVPEPVEGPQCFDKLSSRLEYPSSTSRATPPVRKPTRNSTSPERKSTCSALLHWE